MSDQLPPITHATDRGTRRFSAGQPPRIRWMRSKPTCRSCWAGTAAVNPNRRTGRRPLLGCRSKRPTRSVSLRRRSKAHPSRSACGACPTKRPPERRGDILALRELSTRSARGAIAQFDAGRIVAATWARFWLCFAALGLTLFFLRVVEPFTLRTLCAAAVALVLAIYWCGQFWLLTRQATRIGTRTSKAGRTARAT